MADRNGMSPDLGYPHISHDPNRGYIENDPILRLPNGNIEHGQHGLMNVRAEIARAGYDSGMLDNPTLTCISHHRDEKAAAPCY